MATPHGKLVQINDRNMHIRQMGLGEKTIVLLPGWGVPLPTVEFAPLMRELSKKYTVCTIEFFGYGYSDGTDTPRTNENYVEEIREALTLAGLKPPYVLMPYSCSGIYSEYYTAKYPEEIEGLILLDCTPTTQNYAQVLDIAKNDLDEMESLSKSPELSEAEYEEAIEADIAEYTEHGYTIEEIREIVETIGTLYHMDTQIAQFAALPKNILEVMTMQIPKEIPILVLLYDLRVQLDDDELDEHEKYLKGHMDRLGEHAKCIIIRGSTHADIYYHRNYRKIISKEIDEFLGAVYVQ